MLKYGTTSILLALLVFGVSCCKKLNLEHEEARNVTIENIDFTELNIGEYSGYYAGGMYGWRENGCKVSVDSVNNLSKVVTIKLISSKTEYTQEFLDTLYGRIVREQTLMVDAFSSATLDSKACLKAVENALLKAKNY